MSLKCHDLRLINFNARSLTNKTTDLEYLLASYDPHIANISETWLRPEIKDNEIIPPGYKIFRNDRESRGGGVAIIVKENIQCFLMQGIPNHESVWCQINFENSSFIIGALYRPPSAHISYLEDLQRHLEGLKPSKCKLILAGDFNLGGIDWNNLTIDAKERASCEVLLDIAFNHDLTQVVRENTRIAGSAQSVLDLVFLDACLDNYKVLIQSGLSDHKLVSVELKTDFTTARIKEKTTFVRQYDRADDTSIIDYLSFMLDSFRPEGDVNDLWLQFKDIVSYCISRFVPLRKQRQKKQNPWVTREIIHLKRQIARQRRKRTRNHERIAVLSRQLRTKLSTAKEKYHTETLSNFMVTSPHRFWRHLSQVENNPHSIIMNGSVLHDQKAIASHYNTFFNPYFPRGRTVMRRKNRCLLIIPRKCRT